MASQQGTPARCRCEAGRAPSNSRCCRAATTAAPAPWLAAFAAAAAAALEKAHAEVQQREQQKAEITSKLKDSSRRFMLWKSHVRRLLLGNPAQASRAFG